jgi:hypothetical protein
VKSFSLLAAFFSTALCGSTAAQSWQELSAHLFTNTAIIWQVPTNQLPKSLWVYRRVLPHIFPAAVTSNAVVLGSLQNRGFPSSSTNDFYISQQEPADWPGPIPTLLEIRPCDAYLYYAIPISGPVSEKEVPDDKTVTRLALKFASQLGLDPAKLTHGKIYTNSYAADKTTNIFCGRGVFFSRYLDGIGFFSAVANGEGAEGFSMEFGELGKIQAFVVRWSDIEHYKNERTASQDEITRCIRAHKTIVVPNFSSDDFNWIRRLASVKKLTITGVRLYYGDGKFGEVPNGDMPYGYATPFAELECVAEVENSDVPVRLLSPIISSEVIRLLGQ